jgi:serine protein kinase
MEQHSEFKTLIHQDREIQSATEWQGNLLGYLEKVKENASIAKLAHARIYDIILT